MKPVIIQNKIQRNFLRLFFNFDKWHITPLEERKYALDIIDYCNGLELRKYFVEIGCGLGDIIRNVQFNIRVAYDNDKRILKAASFLSKRQPGGKIQFKQFNFPESELPDRANVIVMVNWIHLIEPVLLSAQIRKYFAENLEPQGQIIIDTVQDKEYKFNHNIHFLTDGLSCKTFKIGAYDREREIWAIIKEK